MASERDDGGPAFPELRLAHSSEGRLLTHTGAGMSLRDWFAGQALAGGHARESVPEYDLRAMFGGRGGIRREEILAADAYLMADAMLKARATPEPK